MNRWERGGSLPKKDNAQRLDDALGADSELMAAWRRSTTGTGWPDWARNVDAIERAARSLSTTSPNGVPGYLQCEAYARAVFTAGLPLATSDELDRLVQLRCERLRQLPDLQVTAVFPTSALMGVGDPERTQQARHLLEWADTGRVALHLVPAGYTLLVPTAPLMVFTLRTGERAVLSDHVDGNVVHEADTHDRISALFTASLAASLPVGLSLEVLRDLA